MRSGSLHVHEPRYKTQNYGANDHQDSLLGSHDLAQPLQKKAPALLTHGAEGLTRISRAR